MGAGRPAREAGGWGRPGPRLLRTGTSQCHFQLGAEQCCDFQRPEYFLLTKHPGIRGFLGGEMGCILRLSQFQGRNKGNSC